MKTLCTLVWIVLLNSNAFAENFFQKVEINIDVWSVTFRDKVGPYGGRYNLTIGDMDRGLTGFRQVLTLKKGEVLHLGDKHWSMDIKPAEKDGKKGIEITRHFTDRRTNKLEETVVFEAEHEEDFADQVDPVTVRALDLARGCVERGEKEKALEALALLRKRLSPGTTKEAEQAVAPNGP
jgi:hypothetical protein